MAIREVTGATSATGDAIVSQPVNRIDQLKRALSRVEFTLDPAVKLQDLNFKSKGTSISIDIKGVEPDKDTSVGREDYMYESFLVTIKVTSLIYGEGMDNYVLLLRPSDKEGGGRISELSLIKVDGGVAELKPSFGFLVPPGTYSLELITREEANKIKLVEPINDLEADLDAHPEGPAT